MAFNISAVSCWNRLSAVTSWLNSSIISVGKEWLNTALLVMDAWHETDGGVTTRRDMHRDIVEIIKSALCDDTLESLSALNPSIFWEKSTYYSPASILRDDLDFGLTSGSLHVKSQVKGHFLPRPPSIWVKFGTRVALNERSAPTSF